MALICAAIASVDTFVLLRMLAACSSCSNCCLCNSGYVLVEFLAMIGLGCLVCTFEVVLASGTATVLFVDFVVPDESFEVCYQR